MLGKEEIYALIYVIFMGLLAILLGYLGYIEIGQ